jgi:hypothetical protein
VARLASQPLASRPICYRRGSDPRIHAVREANLPNPGGKPSGGIARGTRYCFSPGLYPYATTISSVTILMCFLWK